jgi:hypothetical protein
MLKLVMTQMGARLDKPSALAGTAFRHCGCLIFAVVGDQRRAISAFATQRIHDIANYAEVN